MSQVLSFTPKATKQTRWPALSLCCKLLPRTVAQRQIKICYCLFIPVPFCKSLVRQALVKHFCVCWLGTEIKPFGSQGRTGLSEATGTGRIITRGCVSLCSVICNGLALGALLSRYDDDHYV